MTMRQNGIPVIVLITILSIVLLLAGGCTDDTEDEPPTPTPTPTSTPTSILTVTPTPIPAVADYFVDDAGSDETGDGSFSKPWRTITRALVNLRETPSWVLFVMAGRYDRDHGEVFPLSIPSECALHGAGYHYSVLDAQETETVVVLKEATIMGFTVTGGKTTDQNGNGGGISARDSHVINNHIMKNKCLHGMGGGVYLQDSIMVHNRVYQNSSSAGYSGGGVSVQGQSVLINNLIYGNTALRGGGIMASWAANILIVNCSIISNSVSNWGGGISDDYGSIQVINSIIWGNEAASHSNDIYLIHTTSSIEYSCAGNAGDPSLGNITQDPLIVGDYFLSQEAAGQAVTSPCVDSGHPECEVPEIAGMTTRTDFVPDQGRVDMGYHHPVP